MRYIRGVFGRIRACHALTQQSLKVYKDGSFRGPDERSGPTEKDQKAGVKAAPRKGVGE